MLAFPSPHPFPCPHWMVPYPQNPLFTGRDVLLNRLHALLNCKQQRFSTHVCALSGLGGIGKTQIALEYAYRHAQDYTAIFWIAAETSEVLIASFLAIADVLELPLRKEQDQEQTLAAIMHWFNSHEDWLLIFDNVEELKPAKRFWPSAHRGSLLLTTRAQVPGTLAQHMEIPR